MMSVVFLLGLVAYASASSCCSYGDQQKVKAQWNSLWNTPDSSTSKIIFGKEVFARFFEVDPESKSLFGRVKVEDPDSPEFAGHMIRVLTGLDLIINLMGDDAMDAELAHLNTQHIAREGITGTHFTEMFKVLDGSLRQVLEEYDSLSWRYCFRGLGAALKDGLPA
nr:haemoglobin B1 chain [Arenicola marina]